MPARVTGPNGQAGEECHDTPIEDGAGTISSNVIRDPQRGNAPGRFIQRNTSAQVLALSGLQRLAEEIHQELLDDEANAIRDACPRDRDRRRRT